MNLIKESVNGKDVRRQLIWQNADIRVQGKSLINTSLVSRGIRRIDDMVNDNGNMLSYETFIERHPFLRINRLVFMGWCHAIPTKWKRMLRDSRALTSTEREREPEIIIKDKIVLLSLVKTSHFNALLTPEVKPTAQRRWEMENINFEDNWRNIYLMPFRVTTATKLQSLQFKIIHRFFPTRKYLCIRQVIDDPFCSNCGDID